MRFTQEDDVVTPIRVVCCPFCLHWVTADSFGVIESMWLHEYDCEAIAKDYELSVAA
jgi:hypothetical protein